MTRRVLPLTPLSAAGEPAAQRGFRLTRDRSAPPLQFTAAYSPGSATQADVERVQQQLAELVARGQRRLAGGGK